ncbi:MAG: hypothetical protein KQH63_09410 [Desulfobulbaceae bacterium]|nr:hypothetical protein [Desulfobulbaceae bacterium]
MTFFGITFSSSDMYLFGVTGILFMSVITAIIYRKNSIAIRKREERDKIINEIISPFNDTILNIEHGEHNFVMIINSFFTAQNESISRAKAISTEKNKKKIEEAWQKYVFFCENNGKGELYTRFGTFPEEFDREKKEVIKSHISKLTKIIEKI